jgi:hypothetical protein
MKVLYFLADSFTRTFGITQPTAKTRDQAAWLIAGLIVIVAIGMAVVGTVVMRVMAH